MLLSFLQVIRPSALRSWRGNWETWCLCPHRFFRPQGLPLFEIPKLKQKIDKFRNKMWWPRLLFKILFMMRSNLGIIVKNSKMRLCPRLGLNVLWCERSDERYQTPCAPRCSLHGAVQPPTMLLQVPLLTAPSWWNPEFAPVRSEVEPHR